MQTDLTDTDSPPLAPLWHTAILVALMLSVAIVGMLTNPGNEGISSTNQVTVSRVALYLPMIVVQWGLTLYVCRLGRPRNALSALLGRGWTTVGRAAADMALAVAGFALFEGLEYLWANHVGAGHAASIAALLPHTPGERMLWMLVALTAGFCEEVVYRGYLQTQLGAFTRRASLGIALQGVLFGLAHGQQGLAAAGRFTLYGAGLGLLAKLRRSLVAGIICHVLLDAVSGLIA